MRLKVRSTVLLPHPEWADEGGDFPALNAQLDVVHGAEVAVGDGKGARLGMAQSSISISAVDVKAATGAGTCGCVRTGFNKLNMYPP